MAFIFILAVVLIGWAIVQWHRNRPPRPGDPAPDGNLPRFRVVALGTSGAGKTVLIARMFHELTHRAEGRPYTLDASWFHRNQLGGIHQQVLDSKLSWPAGTRIGQEAEYLFPVVVKDRDDRHELFEISYLDYAGELFMPNCSEAEVRKLEAYVDAAHALFGILDGRRLAQYLRDEPDGLTYMHGEILSMIGVLSRSDCPIHFIVTKWDLVRDIGEEDPSDESRLALVRAKLFEHAPIAGLILDSADRRRTVRLIPVSAVGEGFARVDEHGEIVKVAGATASSINLELPFASVVPDYLTQLAERLKERDPLGVGALTSVRVGAHNAWKSLSGATRGLIHAFVPHPTAFAVSAASDLVARWIAVSPEERAKRSNATARRAAASSRSRAQDATIDSFVKSIWLLEAQVPSSVLTGGLAR